MTIERVEVGVTLGNIPYGYLGESLLHVQAQFRQ